jgi:hypothetical protein
VVYSICIASDCMQMVFRALVLRVVLLLVANRYCSVPLTIVGIVQNSPLTHLILIMNSGVNFESTLHFKLIGSWRADPSGRAV